MQGLLNLRYLGHFGRNCRAQLSIKRFIFPIEASEWSERKERNDLHLLSCQIKWLALAQNVPKPGASIRLRVSSISLK